MIVSIIIIIVVVLITTALVKNNKAYSSTFKEVGNEARSLGTSY